MIMGMDTRCLLMLVGLIWSGQALNLAPFFTQDMNQHTLKENIPVGNVVYQLKGEDPEGSRVYYGIEGSDILAVDRLTGVVTVAQDIDRESQRGINDNEIRLTVTIQDEVGEGEGPPNVVRVPISVIILDENDNEPVFQGLPYKTSINEDTPIGTTIFRAIEVTDKDLIGEVLEVKCNILDGGDACDYFELIPRRDETDHDMYRGSVVLKKPLDYREKQVLILPIVVYDGKHTVNTQITFNIHDIQNQPPVFMGSLTGIVNEDDAIGTQVLQVHAKDGDSGNARRIIYDLEENPNGYFAIDINTGEIRVDKTLDRESLGSSSGVLKLKVKASELVNGIPGEDRFTQSFADVTITIRDVNDEAPTFNQQEYDVSIPENVPFGTPLANLNMEVRDTDTGPNALFKLDLLDETGKFAIEPRKANSHTSVSLKVNSKALDYENPNERKFLLLVVASETNTKEKFSSTATVTVQITDLNDNSPTFDKESYTAIVSENAPAGSEIIAINAKDRDSGDFGTAGIRYQLTGIGSELFTVDPISGIISVAPCQQNCLDYERTKAYFLSYSATDNNGEGKFFKIVAKFLNCKKSVVNLRITVGDANDNPPKFIKTDHSASINEGQMSFQPRLILKASDLDDSSLLQYRILDSNVKGLFGLDSATGEVTVNARGGLRLDNIPTDRIQLKVEVSDGNSKDFANVEILVRDINDRAPEFEKSSYVSNVPEDIPINTEIENVRATDADYGQNAEIKYRIQKGAYDDFQIDPETGIITTSALLDYDHRNTYTIEVVAVDGGFPQLSGTTTVTLNVMNKNNKVPYFSPATFRKEITENTPEGSLVIQLNATDPDADNSNLLYLILENKISAVDRDGKKVDLESHSEVKSFFSINENTGEIFVANKLDRNMASTITLPVRVTDTSALKPQHGEGTVVITLVDINDYPPQFHEPWTLENPYITINVPEEQPNGTVVYKFMATDPDSNVDYFKIKPVNQYFDVDKESGNLVIKSRIDYESLDQKRITFDLHVYDSGVPKKSASAVVIANIANINDNNPIFQQESYSAEVPENSEAGTSIMQVQATDQDDGDFGVVSYYLSGAFQEAFHIDPASGVISIVDPSIFDREQYDFIPFQVVATDAAPYGSQHSVTAPVNITIGDVNDNPPYFLKSDYEVTIVDNIPYYPEPSPIIQVLAADPDTGKNGELYFTIIAGNEDGRFGIDPTKGIIYPNTSFIGQSGKRFDLTVQVADEGGRVEWPNPDRARVMIDIENVNTHKPEWDPEPPQNQTIEIPEESIDSEVVIMKVTARDDDFGENQRISYYLKVKNKNVHETEKFSINQLTGELIAKGRFDREEQDRYELVLVARDHGTPVAFETLRFLTVVIKDINDNGPRFTDSLTGSNMVRFTVPEEEEPGYFVGRVLAKDPDEGVNGRVFYYIVGGNEGRWFSVDKTYGNIYTKRKLDRETQNKFELTVKATNNADYVCEGSTCDLEMTSQDVAFQSVIIVQIFVQDKNDNLPKFRNSEFFVGIPYRAKVGDLILNAEAHDPDLNADARLSYSIRSSNLYRSGMTTSSGSLVPSPFKMEDNGRLTLGALMAEFNQDRFIIDIEAKESNSNHRAKAKVHLWIYEPEQLIKLIIAKSPMEVNKNKDKIVSELRNVTQEIIVIDDIKFHVDDNNILHRDMTDMMIHGVSKEENVILMPEEVLKTIDQNYDHLSLYYEEAGIHSILPATSSKESTFIMDSNLIALIILILLIFFGVIMFSILCCCMKSWVAKATSDKPILPLKQPAIDTTPIYNNPTSILDETPASPISPTPAGGTDNPLWIDQKYKAYEEQELTMTVFSDQENSIISGANNDATRPESISRQSHLMDSQSNAYATISKVPMVPASRRGLFNDQQQTPFEPPRDYATLEKQIRSPPGPLVPGIHSTPIQTNLERRFSNEFNPANLVINNNGEPELVGDLM